MAKDALFNSLSSGVKGVSQRYASSGRSISPSYIDSVGRCPMKAFVERFSTSSYDAYIRNSLDAEGTAVHKAIEDSMNFLIDKRGNQNVQGQLLKDLISEASTRAEQSLKRHVPVNNANYGRMRSYVNNVISEYGKEYLTNLNIEAATEFNVKSSGIPGGRQLAGNIDMLLYDKSTRAMRIFDFKWAGRTKAETSHDFMSAPVKDFSLLGTGKAQPRVYAYTLLEQYGANIDSIQMVYDINWNGDGTRKSGRQIVKSDVLKTDDKAVLATQLSDDIAHIISKEQKVASSITGRSKDSAIRAIGMLSKGTCNHQTCNGCPMRYQCSFRSFVEDAVDSANGSKGQWSTDSELNKLKHLENKEFVKTMEQQYNEFTETSFTKRRRETYLSLRKDGLSVKEAGKAAYEDAMTFKASLDSFKTTRRGLFQDSLVAGIDSSRSNLMFSILDKDFKASWMSHDIRRSIAKYSYSHIEEMAHQFDVNVDLAKEIVMDAVYKDRENAFKLNRMMVDNTNKAMDEMGLTLKGVSQVTDNVEENVKFALRKYEKTISHEMANVVQESLNKEFLKFVMSIDQEVIKNKLGPDVMNLNIDDIMKRAVDLKVIDKGTTKFMSQVAKSETFGDIFEKAGGSLNKFPLGSVMIAGMLSYIAGVNSVNELISSKYEKLRFYMSHNKEEIDAGQHASVYSSARRIMYSDFGSPMRWIYKRSKAALDHMKNMTGGVKDMLNVAHSVDGKNLSWRELASKSIVSTGQSIKRSSANLEFLKKNPGVFMAGAAAGFLAFGVLPNVHTSRDVTESSRERRRRFKRVKQTKWGRTSSNEAPESELREWYRRWTPIGSSIIGSATLEIISNAVKRLSLMEYAESGKKVFTNMMPRIKEELIDVWDGVSRRAENIYSKSRLTSTLAEHAEDISEHASYDAVNGRFQKIIKDSAMEGEAIKDLHIEKAKSSARSYRRRTKSKEAAYTSSDKISKYELNRKAGQVAKNAVDSALSEDTTAISRIAGNIITHTSGTSPRTINMHTTKNHGTYGDIGHSPDYSRQHEDMPVLAPARRRNRSMSRVDHPEILKHKHDTTGSHMFYKSGQTDQVLNYFSSTPYSMPVVAHEPLTKSRQKANHPVKDTNRFTYSNDSLVQVSTAMLNTSQYSNLYHGNGSKFLNKLHNLTNR